MRRSIGIFIAGVLAGGGIVLTVISASRTAMPLAGSPPPISIRRSPTNSSSSSEKPADHEDKILLGDIRTVPFQELYGLLSSRTPEQLRQLAEQLENLPPGKETAAKTILFFKTWAQFDAKTAMTAALSFKTPEIMSVAIDSVIEGADATVASKLALPVNDAPLSPGQKSGFLGKAVTKWAQVEPISAAKFLDSIGSDGQNFVAAWRSVAENWAASDPAAALAWVDSHMNAQNTKFVLSAALRPYLQNDPHGAEAYVATHIDEPGHQQLASLIADSISKEDPARAKEWVSQLSNPEARRYGNHSIAMQTASTDPQAASEWAATLPDVDRALAINVAVIRWAKKDPQAAAQWLTGLNGAARDEAISSYSIGVWAQDPAAALTWATSVSDPMMREMSVQRIVSSWARRDPGQATDWVQNSALPDAQKSRLIASMRRR